MTNTLEATTDFSTRIESSEQKQPLRHTIKDALHDYFNKVGDALTCDLYNLVLAEVEAPLMEAVMKYTKGNQSKAAILLGLSRGTLRKKLKQYGLL